MVVLLSINNRKFDRSTQPRIFEMKVQNANSRSLQGFGKTKCKGLSWNVCTTDNSSDYPKERDEKAGDDVRVNVRMQPLYEIRQTFPRVNLRAGE